MTRHRSSAYVQSTAIRGRSPITDQFRFIIRMAVACDAQRVPYTVQWDRRESAMLATITATGPIPTPDAVAQTAEAEAGPGLEARHLGRGISLGGLPRRGPEA